jgi:hypothetical protein
LESALVPVCTQHEGPRGEVKMDGATSFLDEVEALGICCLSSIDKVEVIVVHTIEGHSENVGMRRLNSP